MSSQCVNSSNNVTGGGVDYNSGPYSVTFTAGQTSVSFDVPINDEDIFEDDENFSLTINPSSLPPSCSLGDPSSATVTIVNDEGECG